MIYKHFKITDKGKIMDLGNDSFSRGSNVDKLEIILFLKIMMVPVNNSYHDFETQRNKEKDDSKWNHKNKIFCRDKFSIFFQPDVWNKSCLCPFER